MRILEELSQAAEALIAAVGHESPFQAPLLCYKRDVDKLVSVA